MTTTRARFCATDRTLRRLGLPLDEFPERGMSMPFAMPAKPVDPDTLAKTNQHFDRRITEALREVRDEDDEHRSTNIRAVRWAMSATLAAWLGLVLLGAHVISQAGV